MKTRWSTLALLSAVVAALLLTPTLASAQVFFFRPGGGYGGYTFGGPGGGYGGFGGYGGYGGYGYRPFFYSPPVYSMWSQQTSYNNYNLGGYYPGYSGYPGNALYQPRMVAPGYEPQLGGNYGNLGGFYARQTVLPTWVARASDTLPRMRPTLEPALIVPLSTTAPETDTKAHIRVQVPLANAEVLFDGVATTQTGMVREFMSPSLEPGTYTYTVVARWTVQGQPRTEKRTVSVRPGSNVVVDFTAP